MARACPSCGTLFPDYANVCHHDGVALLGIPQRAVWPSLNWNIAVGSLALAATVWAGARVADAYFGWNLYGGIESIELADGEASALRIKFNVENRTGVALDSVQLRLEIPLQSSVTTLETDRLAKLPKGSTSAMSVLVDDGDLRSALLKAPPSGLAVDLKAEAAVCVLGRCLPVGRSRTILLKIPQREVLAK